MTVALIAAEAMKQEFLSQGLQTGIELISHAEIEGVEDVDAVIDLLFKPGPDRIAALEKTGADVIVVNYVTGTTKDLPSRFVRINGWPGFLAGSPLEAASSNEKAINLAKDLFEALGKKISWVPDEPGFVSARVVASIINEAYHACGEKVSSREEIDTAMKLGTGYPFGPFEWSRMIGVAHVYELLVNLSKNNKRYQPAVLLAKEALS